MSLLEVNEVTPKAKLLTGCGDGVRNELHHEKPPKGGVRTPVPSCRRFATRPPPTQRNDHADVKVQLQKAIQELATHPNITRRRSLTMAEINPTRTVTRISDGLRLSSPVARGAGGVKALVAATPSREKDAGRRVCQLLVLNAWRRRRTQVATLSDSLGALETQNGKLELQIDVLQRLRQAECEKRTEAVTENHHLHNQMDETLKDNEILTKEKANLEKEMGILEQREENLQLDVQNVRNDWMTVRCELTSAEQQMGIERVKIKKLREEKNLLLERLTQQEQDAIVLNEQIEDLQEKLLNTEITLQDTILSNSNYEDDMKKLLQKISSETAANSELQKKLQELVNSKEKLETKVQELIKSIYKNRESTKKLDQENQKLKRDLIDVREALKQEQIRPWWKNAGELALAPFNALQNAAYIMLPAIPNTITQATSTTDIPMTS